MARKMRDSGVEWIGEVPEGWEVNRLQWHLEELADKNDPIQTTNILSLTNDRGVIPYEDKGNVGNKAKENYTEYKLAYKNTIVANSMNVLIGSVGLSKYDGCVSPVYYIYKSKDSNSIRYYNYLFQLTPFQKELRRYANGILEIRLRVSSSDILKRSVPAPSFSEQRRIADYLDEKCAAIDGAVGELKRGIEDCKAWKKAIIFEAVTGKANVLAAKNAKVAKRQMRDSGIPWIGEIPEGWEVSRVKNECINFDSLREPISAENRENKQGLYDYYGASGVIDKIDDYNVDDTVLLIGEDGANLRMRNLPLVYKATGKFWVNNHAHILKPKEGRDYDFMAYALEAGDYNDFITGSAQPKLSQANLMAYPIALPPLPEQQAIANYLDEKCAAIDALVAEKEKLIADLEAYKKSLIFELVTGKREVA